jgi:hypothetical protein
VRTAVKYRGFAAATSFVVSETHLYVRALLSRRPQRK